jgi:hypothetical protein
MIPIGAQQRRCCGCIQDHKPDSFPSIEIFAFAMNRERHHDNSDQNHDPWQIFSAHNNFFLKLRLAKSYFRLENGMLIFCVSFA